MSHNLRSYTSPCAWRHSSNAYISSRTTMRARRHAKPQKILRLSRSTRSLASRTASSAEMSPARVTVCRSPSGIWQRMNTSPAVHSSTWLPAAAPVEGLSVAEASPEFMASVVRCLVCSVIAVLPIQIPTCLGQTSIYKFIFYSLLLTYSSNTFLEWNGRK